MKSTEKVLKAIPAKSTKRTRTVSDIVNVTGLAYSTVANTVLALRKEGKVEVVRKVRTGRAGRPAPQYARV